MTKPNLRIQLIMPRIEQRDYFVHLLSMRYTVIFDRKTPDIVLYDDYSKHLLPRYKNDPFIIAFTGESEPLDYSICHFALSFDETNPKSIYLPLWVLFIDWFNVKDPDYCKLTDIMVRKPVHSVNREHFCGFVAKHSVEVRNNFVITLSEYRAVICPGVVLNNYPPIGGRMGNSKETFLRKCKFTIAFENTSKDGYITEKILHAFQSRTIPIYWGSPTVTQYFNPKAFINCHDYEMWSDVIDEIIRLDNDDEAYLEMLNQPVFENGLIPIQFWPSTLLDSIEYFILNNINGR